MDILSMNIKLSQVKEDCLSGRGDTKHKYIVHSADSVKSFNRLVPKTISFKKRT
jgi:hypothetical protein